MANDLQHIWRTDDAPRSFTRPEDLVKRSTRFERTIRRRNFIEYVAGALLLCLEVPAFIMFVMMGEPLMAGAMVLMLLGTLWVLWNQYTRASMQRRRPEEDCRSHLVSQYRRQADALRTVPMWYIGPLLPGVLGVYGTVAFKAIGEVDAWDILTEMGPPFGATLAFFGFVIWLNQRAARSLQRRAEELEAV
ncbi:hypothetical protein AAG612_02765 [Citromicrobium bathyomarinum]|uniref:hypothetical protein n=1 Tax=Citromicrobium bathyomarinum TaxID=72174 RepID=UPI00315B1FF1